MIATLCMGLNTSSQLPLASFSAYHCCSAYSFKKLDGFYNIFLLVEKACTQTSEQFVQCGNYKVHLIDTQGFCDDFDNSDYDKRRYPIGEYLYPKQACACKKNMVSSAYLDTWVTSKPLTSNTNN